uniref:Uncharacterized protein n=1 Tax=Panagrolaimus sp. PS1159 TaxID=55785 RepID=A0AC35F4K4_9BILA
MIFSFEMHLSLFFTVFWFWVIVKKNVIKRKNNKMKTNLLALFSYDINIDYTIIFTNSNEKYHQINGH